MKTESSHAPLVALVIDDEPQIRRLLRVTLEANGYRVFDAATGAEGIVMAAQCRPEIVLLDLGLPDYSGVEVVRRLREWSQVPVVILSVKDSEEDKVAALDAGADDYVTKPFGSSELLARMRTAVRHSQPQGAGAVFHSSGLEVDFAARVVKVRGVAVDLTPIEYSLLRLLLQHAGKVLTHRYLLTEVWGPKAVEQTHTLRVHVANLRKKLEEDAGKAQFIRTESGIGYRFIG